MSKLNAAGIKYIADVYEEFEEHLEKLACAILDRNVSIDMSDCNFWAYPYTLSWEIYFRGRVDDGGRLDVTEEELCSTDYEAIREKYKKIRTDAQKKKEEAERLARIERERAAYLKKIEQDKVTLKKLMEKYPDVAEAAAQELIKGFDKIHK